MDPKIQFIALLAFAAGSFLLGLIGFLYTPAMIQKQMVRIRDRRLEPYIRYVSLLLRILFIALSVLSGYLLSKLPLVYHCAFK